jgi:AraC family carnitine catabolism transcriptional activator
MENGHMTQLRGRSVRILMLVAPNFNISATMSFIDPFRAANYLDGQTHFQWEFVSRLGGPCLASNGVSIETYPLHQVVAKSYDFVVVSTSWTPEKHATPETFSALRNWARSGATIGALDTGAFVLAEAGLLKGRRATVHYEHIDAFTELYPNVDVVENLFVLDGNRMTCCGGAASADVGIQILQELRGARLANAAARYVFHDRLRDPTAMQLPDGEEPLGNNVPRTVRAAIRLMEKNLEEPVSIPDLCRQVGISQRQLDRLFVRHIKKTPSAYYRDIRLDRARGLVTQTEMPIAEIAVASGFSGPVHFSKAYSGRFGLPPVRDRIEGRVPFEFRAWPMHRRMLED